MVNAVVTEIPLRLEPVTDDAFETAERTDAEREAILARIAALFGSAEPRRAIDQTPCPRSHPPRAPSARSTRHRRPSAAIGYVWLCAHRRGRA